MALDEEHLILLVAKYPEIYDLQNDHYMNNIRKNNIWKEIAEELGVTDTICKEKWKHLRDSYYRNLKKRKCKSGDGSKTNKRWKYEHQMKFLIPYFQVRKTQTNIENNESIMSDDSELMPSPEPVNSPLSFSSATSLINKNITRRKKKPTQALSVAGALQQYLASRPTVTTPTIETGDPIHSFFKAMADSVKALPPDLQLKAKNKIFTVVSDLEYENMLKSSTPSTQQTAEETTTYLADYSKTPTQSTSGLNKQFLKPHTASRSQPHVTQRVDEFVFDNFEHEFENTANNESQCTLLQDQQVQIASENESQSILDTRKKYIITTDGYLISQDIYNNQYLK